MNDLRKAAEALIKHWEAGEFQNCTGDMAGHIRLLRQALAQPDPAQWIGLTDEEIKEIVGFWGDTPVKGYTRKLFDQIEAKLREKNS